MVVLSKYLIIFLPYLTVCPYIDQELDTLPYINSSWWWILEPVWTWSFKPRMHLFHSKC